MPLILGRSPNLWLGAFTLVFNVFGLALHIEPSLQAAINAAAGAVILLVAGSDTVQIASGQAAIDRQPK